MRGSFWILLVALAAGRVGWAQPGPSPLARPVRPTLTDASLTGVLATLSRQSGVPFSYSSTRIGGQRRCHLRPGASRPLGVVLREIAGQFQLSYGLLNGQLVLWPASEAAPPGITELNGLGQAAVPPSVAPTRPAVPKPVVVPSAAAVRTPAVGAVGGAGGAGSSAGRTGEPGSPILEGRLGGTGRARSSVGPLGTGRAGISLVQADRPHASALATRQSINGTAAARHRSGKAVPSATTGSPAALTDSIPNIEPGEARLGAAIPLLLPRLVALAEVAVGSGERPVALAVGPAPASVLRPPLVLRRHLAQLSLLPPLSSNGLANARTVNGYSLNVLAGYSAGVSRLELGGLLNVVRDSVHGLQAAGLVNVTGTDVRGVQLAGLANVNGGAVRGVQGAGLINIARDDVRGLQIAGLVNVTGGAARAVHRPDQPTRMRRWLGLPRLLATDPLSQLPAAPSRSQRGLLVQAAALANLTGTDVRGLQTATFLNVAHHVSGVQFGLVNVARRVHGVQLGLINIADSVDGASLGLINIVRHGYLHGEVWASETLPLNAVLKMGVRRYYTLLGVAAEPFGSRVQWAGGFGVGTAGRPHGRFTLSLDLLQWTLAGTTDDTSNQLGDTRMLTQLRPAMAWQIERQGHLQLVVVPTLNLAVATGNNYQPQWDFGANQLLLINSEDAESRTRLWPGLQIGLRF